MKIGTMMAILVTALTVAQATDRFENRLPAVTVYVQVGFSDTRLKLCRAEGIASEMFGQAGVQIQWRTGRPQVNQEEHPILIDLSTDTPETLSRGALAYARVYEGVHIRIFWDRIQKAGDRELAHELLAHVFVHEITHILEGIDRHSEDGVMKAHWTAHDLLEMEHKPLAFDPEDLRLIQSGLACYCLAGEMTRSKACTTSKEQLAKKSVILRFEAAASKR